MNAYGLASFDGSKFSAIDGSFFFANQHDTRGMLGSRDYLGSATFEAHSRELRRLLPWSEDSSHLI